MDKRTLPSPLGEGSGHAPHLGGDTGVEREEAVRDVRVEGDQAIPCCARIHTYASDRTTGVVRPVAYRLTPYVKGK